ncbi:hypothetical protein BS50DRAFT_574606 [Corynespora cassiicola Philippines]|uniref:Uncharacterized protein n=1 Tax=Corynespora cassiicola Philippines TaxID=1448308 RepID=A0A2T2NM69_CORCC|nr:hypothetical protein BS50DRAFT_574606 [Corynespora cassiicola Philippines]
MLGEAVAWPSPCLSLSRFTIENGYPWRRDSQNPQVVWSRTDEQGASSDEETPCDQGDYPERAERYRTFAGSRLGENNPQDCKAPRDIQSQSCSLIPRPGTSRNWGNEKNCGFFLTFSTARYYHLLSVSALPPASPLAPSFLVFPPPSMYPALHGENPDPPAPASPKQPPVFTIGIVPSRLVSGEVGWTEASYLEFEEWREGTCGGGYANSRPVEAGIRVQRA